MEESCERGLNSQVAELDGKCLYHYRSGSLSSSAQLTEVTFNRQGRPSVPLSEQMKRELTIY
jgi:hypothetical protein